MSEHPTVHVDKRGRMSLAGVRRGEWTEYTAEEDPEYGVITLTPAVTISPFWLAALQNPELVNALEAHRAAGRNPAAFPDED